MSGGAHASSIEVLKVKKPYTADHARPWPVFEIWTRNRVYAVDVYFQCVIVYDRESGHEQPTHALLGAALVGGQRSDQAGRPVAMTHPLPERGMSAVFRLWDGVRERTTETSTVDRVVVRQRELMLSPSAADPSWEDVSAATSYERMPIGRRSSPK